jgi:methionyl-tRNA formyltransferase
MSGKMVTDSMSVGLFGDIPTIVFRIESMAEMTLSQILTRCPDTVMSEGREVQELTQPYHQCVGETLSNGEFDVLVTAGFPVILTEAELSSVDFVINVHKGLLPRNRGRHAIATAFDQNWSVTGVTVHEILPAIDGGPLLAQERLQIGVEDDYDSIRFKTDVLGADLVEEVLETYYARGKVPSTPQNDEFSTYYHPRTPADSRIEWANESSQICKLVSAARDDFSAHTYLDGTKISIHDCAVFDEYDGSFTQNTAPGTILEAETESESLLVTTGSGTLVVTDYSHDENLNISPGTTFH